MKVLIAKTLAEVGVAFCRKAIIIAGNGMINFEIEVDRYEDDAFIATTVITFCAVAVVVGLTLLGLNAYVGLEQ